MKKVKWFVGLLASLLFLPVKAETPLIWQTLVEPQNQIDFVCTVLYIDQDICDSIVYPKVKVTPYYPGVLGFYKLGGDTIYITPWGIKNQTPPGVVKTVIHELTHYIHDHYLGGIKSGCGTEALAWHVSNAYLVYIGKHDQVRHDWWTWYNCPAPGPVAGSLAWGH